MEQTLKVCIYGATGYTASELIRALSNHSNVNIVSLISRSNAGKRVGEVLPHLEHSLGNMTLSAEPEEDYHLAFLCLPHEASMDLVPDLLSQGKKVVDLSGAYRIKDASTYEEFYGFEHTHTDLLERSVYGLTEIFRERIKSADLVANPGCYPTATLLGIYPFLKEGIEIEEVIIHALSGVSGAGRTPKQHFHYPEMEGNFFSYSVQKHRHTPEMEGIIKEILGREVKVRFTPTVVPAQRGMISTVYLKADTKDVKDIFTSAYKNEQFVKVIDKPPMTKWVLGTNNCFVYPFYDPRTDTHVIISAIDNLGKGASLQAVQNMNIMAGFPEEEGIPTAPLFP